ncbi:hypothetical protein [Streptomyces sp. t39]|nr:hypothetical protein [Streptomyces sp. t39]
MTATTAANRTRSPYDGDDRREPHTRRGAGYLIKPGEARPAEARPGG